jgi:hypothetical protein
MKGVIHFFPLFWQKIILKNCPWSTLVQIRRFRCEGRTDQLLKMVVAKYRRQQTPRVPVIGKLQL